MKTDWTRIIFVACAFSIVGQAPVSEHRLADSLQRKLEHIEHNAQSTPPDQAPTVMTEEEINDYFAAGRVKLPIGVKRVTFSGQSEGVTSLATVDFDEIRAGQRSSNPMLSLFSGIHNVRIEADAAGASGIAKVHVRTVSMDGIEVPRIALEFFAARFLKPKYPNVGLDSEFQMPDKIDTATVGYHKLRVTQR